MTYSEPVCRPRRLPIWRTALASATAALLVAGLAPATASAAPATAVMPTAITASELSTPRLNLEVGSWNLCNSMCNVYDTMGTIAQRASRYAAAIKTSGISYLSLQETNPTEAATVAKAVGSNWATSPGSVENNSIIYNKNVWSPKSASGSTLKYGYIQNATTLTKKKTPYQMLRNISTGETILFLSVHQHFGASGPEYAEHRAEQARKIVAGAKAVAGTTYPIIIAGDMNSTFYPETNDAASLLVYEGAGYNAIEKIAREFTPSFETGTFNGGKNAGPGNAYALGFHIDHVFLPKGMTSGGMHQISDPLASDHNLIFTDVEMAAPPTIKVETSADNPVPGQGTLTVSGSSVAGVPVQVTSKDPQGVTKTILSAVPNSEGRFSVTLPTPTAGGNYLYSAKTVQSPNPSSSTSPVFTLKIADGKQTPTGLAVKSNSPTSLAFTWNVSPGAPQYRIQLSTKSDMSSPTYHRFYGASGVVASLKANTKYYAKIRTISASGTTNLSSYSSAIAGTTMALPPGAAPLPASAKTIPTGFVGQSNSNKSIAYSWNKVEGAPRYRVQMSTRSDMSNAVYYRLYGTSSAILELKANTAYYAKIRTITNEGENLSGYSKAVKVTTLK